MFNGIHKIYNRVTDVDLYHGAPHQKDMIEADSIHYGNKIKDPYWAAYFWREEEKALFWSVYRTLYYHYKNNGIKDKDFQYHPQSGGMMIIKKNKEKLKKLLLNKKVFVHHVREKIYKLDVGHDRYIEEYTVDHDVKPDNVEGHVIDDRLFNRVITTVDEDKFHQFRKAIRKGEIKFDRGFLKILMISDEEKINRMNTIRKNKESLVPKETDLSNIFGLDK